MGAWMINMDFNLIYRAEDKNNTRLNRRLMGQFQQLLNEALLKECHLEGHLYTWSYEREHRTREKIDCVFITNECEAIHPNHHLHSLASPCSDHTPLVLKTDASFAGKKHFHFRSIWIHATDFLEVVASARSCPLHDASPFKRLDWLFRNTASVLKSYSDRFVGNVQMQLEITKVVIHRLEVVRDHHNLAPFEQELRKLFKGKTLGLASLQRSIACQESRVHWLSEGDTPTRFFQAYANSRKCRNHIHELECDGRLLSDEQGTPAVIFNYFDAILGTTTTR
jgi:hypothetical protein